MALLPPPDPVSLDPLIVTFDSHRELLRVHDFWRSPVGFNPGLGRPSRFAPLTDPRPAAPGATQRIVPTLYGARAVAAALSESVFHDVPVGGPFKRILVSRLKGLVISRIRPRRSLRLALLAGPGLTRLGLRRRDLIDTDPDAYPETAAWALALHDSPPAPDGLLWMSRLDDRSSALVLFGDRVDEADLEVVMNPVPLWHGVGLALVEALAADAGILVIV